METPPPKKRVLKVDTHGTTPNIDGQNHGYSTHSAQHCDRRPKVPLAKTTVTVTVSLRSDRNLNPFVSFLPVLNVKANVMRTPTLSKVCSHQMIPSPSPWQTLRMQPILKAHPHRPSQCYVDGRYLWSFWRKLWQAEWVAYPFACQGSVWRWRWRDESLGVNKALPAQCPSKGSKVPPINVTATVMEALAMNCPLP